MTDTSMSPAITFLYGKAVALSIGIAPDPAKGSRNISVFEGSDR